jgi:signal peptidase I
VTGDGTACNLAAGPASASFHAGVTDKTALLPAKLALSAAPEHQRLSELHGEGQREPRALLQHTTIIACFRSLARTRPTPYTGPGGMTHAMIDHPMDEPAESVEAPGPPPVAQPESGSVVAPAATVDASGTGRGGRLLRQIVVTLACGALFALILQVCIQNYLVEGDSMWPSVFNGDRVLVDRLAYRFSAPKRGDLVVFRFPRSWANMNLIKRIIGVPGDTVEVQPGVVFVNGIALNEPYVRDIEQYWYGPARVPPGQYFVLGDNREVDGHQVSYDSHQWGFLPANDIYGRVMVTYWPISDFHLFGF